VIFAVIKDYMHPNCAFIKVSLKQNTMREFYFNIQAKGGVGKSMLTYLQALKHQDDKRTYFIDFDSCVKSSPAFSS
jgi:hypothetical protein